MACRHGIGKTYAAIPSGCAAACENVGSCPNLYLPLVMLPPDPELLLENCLVRRLTRFSRLELGAGGGIVGLTVAKGCSLSFPLYLTDQLEMESLMQHNITLNNLDGQVKARVLNW